MLAHIFVIFLYEAIIDYYFVKSMKKRPMFSSFLKLCSLTVSSQSSLVALHLQPSLSQLKLMLHAPLGVNIYIIISLFYLNTKQETKQIKAT